jgi:hypothetical protein
VRAAPISIGAEAEPEKGATFYFTLPTKPNELLVFAAGALHLFVTFLSASSRLQSERAPREGGGLSLRVTGFRDSEDSAVERFRCVEGCCWLNLSTAL